MGVDVLAAEPLLALRAELGEGPVWDHRSRRLVWVDILGGLVHLTSAGSGLTLSIPAGQHVGAVALRGSSSYLLAVRDGFAVLDGEEVGPVTAVFDDPVLRMNDGGVDPAGRFLAGTMAYDGAPEAGTLYVRDLDGSVRPVVEPVTVSNGLAWSEGGEVMYYVDSATGGVDIFDYDVDRGLIANRRRHLSIEPAAGIPDGLTLDAEGCLWLALFGAGEVRRYSPAGSLIARVEVPARQVTSCAFGGDELDTLFVTSACHRLDLSDPGHDLAGHLFAVNPGCAGRREPVVPVPDR
jgi:sugar lactone lactonase YvrE